MKHLKAIFRSPLISILLQIKHGMDKIMATIEEVEAKLVAADGKIDAVAADVTAMRAKIDAIPTAGMTPEQQAGIDGLATHADAIIGRLSGIDAAANPAP